jgi:integrase/recombinase XerD
MALRQQINVTWRDLSARDATGQATVFGKGGKTRVIVLPASAWRALAALRNDAAPDAGPPRVAPSMPHRFIAS